MINTNSKRINQIVDFIDSKVIAEIGADHGHITMEAFNKDKIEFAYLTDLRESCLEKAKKNFSGKNYEKKVAFGVGDGLLPLDELVKSCEKKPQQIIIAGMGGKEVKKILSQNGCYSDFILGPQKNIVDLREFLCNNNYYIQDEKIVKEGDLFYFVLKVKKGNVRQELTDLELSFGKDCKKNKSKDFLEYLKKEKDLCNKILQTKEVIKKRKELVFIDEILTSLNKE